jgi:hypothetical protein
LKKNKTGMNYLNISDEIISIIIYCFLVDIFGFLLCMLLLEIIPIRNKNRIKKQGNKMSVRIEKEDDKDHLIIFEDYKHGYRYKTIRLKNYEYQLLKYNFAENLPKELLLEIIELSREEKRISETEIAEKAYRKYRKIPTEN